MASLQDLSERVKQFFQTSVQPQVQQAVNRGFNSKLGNSQPINWGNVAQQATQRIQPIAQQVASNLSPTNFNTPVVGGIRRFNQQNFGTPSYVKAFDQNLPVQQQNTAIQDLALSFSPAGITKVSNKVGNVASKQLGDFLAEATKGPGQTTYGKIGNSEVGKGLGRVVADLSNATPAGLALPGIVKGVSKLGQAGKIKLGSSTIPTKTPPLTQIKSSSQLPKTSLSSAVDNMASSLDGSIPQGKIRGFPQTVISTKTVPKEIKAFAKTQTYEPLKNNDVLANVSQIIKQGDSQAISFAKTDDTVVGNGTAMVMLRKLIDQGRIDEANDLIAAVSPRFTKQGQEIQILSQFSRLTPAGATRWAQSFIDKANKANPRLGLKLTPEKTAMITGRAKALEKLEDGSRAKIVATAELLRDIKEVVPPSWGQRIATIQTMAQLLNPKTLIRNVVGNNIFTGLENVSDTVGTGIDMATSLVTGQRSKVLPSLTAQAKGFGQGLMEGADDAFKGIDTSGGVATQFDLPPTRTFTGKYNPLTYLEKSMNLALRAPDRASFQAAYDGSISNQLRAAGTDVITPQMQETAFADGLYRTFQDNSRLAEIFTGTKKLLNKAGTPDGKFGVGDLILKYPKTPANLLSRSLDYSPVGFLKGIYQGARPLLTGQPFDQKTFVEALSRGAVGTGMLAMGYELARNGIISGRPNKDFDISAAEREIGAGPFRVNLSALKRYILTGKAQTNEAGDNLATFDWAQPSSLAIAMGANFNINPKGQDWFTSAIEQLDAGASTLTQQSLVKGVTGFSKDVGQYGPIRALTNTVLAAPASFVPTASNQVTQAQDNTVRETYDPSILKEAQNKVTARIPGLAQGLPARVGVLGKPQERYQNGTNSIFNVFFNPAFVSKISDNPTAKEVLDIFERSGETQQAPRVVDKKIQINGQSKALTAEELGKYQTYVGRRADQAIRSFLNDPNYQQASDTDKAKFVGNILTDINTAAKIELFGHQPANVSKTAKSILEGKFAPVEPTGDSSKSMVTPAQALGNGTLSPSVKASSSDGIGITKEGNLTLSSSGKAKDTSPLVMPKLTGNEILDKKLISKFNSRITTESNAIVKDYQEGKIDAQQANTQLKALEDLRTSTSKAKPKKAKVKKAKKISAPKVKLVKVAPIKIGKNTFKVTKAKTSKAPKFKAMKMKKLKLA